jgi:predicted 3-demethylubiquinone-9 3-methyltransferase (glyoxalase superfamily)
MMITSPGAASGVSPGGWIDSDKFGVSWQIVPVVLGELMSDPDALIAESTMNAMQSMKKLDPAALKKASGKK